MFHGLTACPYELKEIAGVLSNKDYTVSVPLLPGHGTCYKNLNETVWQDWHLAAKEALFKLRKQCKTIIVGGLSTGASLALHLAAHYQVEGIIALAPGMFLRNKIVPFLPFIRWIKKYHKKRNGPDIRDQEARRNSLGYNKIALKSITEAVKLYRHLQEDLSDIYVPLFIAQSINDHVVRYEGAEYIYKHVSSVHKQFLRLEKSYHVISLDVEKEILKRELLKFIHSVFTES